jgi:hypothetical protein
MKTNSNKYKGLVSNMHFNIFSSIRVNGRFIIPRMGRKVLLLILHVLVFVIVTAAVVIIIVVFDVFVASQKMRAEIQNYHHHSKNLFSFKLSLILV